MANNLGQGPWEHVKKTVRELDKPIPPQDQENMPQANVEVLRTTARNTVTAFDSAAINVETRIARLEADVAELKADRTVFTTSIRKIGLADLRQRMMEKLHKAELVAVNQSPNKRARKQNKSDSASAESRGSHTHSTTNLDSWADNMNPRQWTNYLAARGIAHLRSARELAQDSDLRGIRNDEVHDKQWMIFAHAIVRGMDSSEECHRIYHRYKEEFAWTYDKSWEEASRLVLPEQVLI